MILPYSISKLLLPFLSDNGKRHLHFHQYWLHYIIGIQKPGVVSSYPRTVTSPLLRTSSVTRAAGLLIVHLCVCGYFYFPIYQWKLLLRLNFPNHIFIVLLTRFTVFFFMSWTPQGRCMYWHTQLCIVADWMAFRYYFSDIPPSDCWPSPPRPPCLVNYGGDCQVVSYHIIPIIKGQFHFCLWRLMRSTDGPVSSTRYECQCQIHACIRVALPSVFIFYSVSLLMNVLFAVISEGWLPSKKYCSIHPFS